jgi:hypothetical protein
MSKHFFVFYFAFTLFLGISSKAYECTNRDIVDSNTLKLIASVNSTANLKGEARVKFYAHYGSLFSCPKENYQNSNLTAIEKRNLLKLFKYEMILNFESYIADNLHFVDLDSALQSYKRIHELAYGENTPLPQGVQMIIQNKELYKLDRKKQCSEKYVDTKHMGPVRNQDDIGWCYAFAAADLMSFHAGRTLSAVDVAILNNNYANDAVRDRLELPGFLRNTEALRSFYESNKIDVANLKENYLNHLFDSKREGGYPVEALKIAMNKGVCTESDLPSQPTNKNTSLYSELQKPAQMAEQSKSLVCFNEQANYGSLLPNLNYGEIIEIASRTSPMQILLSLRKKNCRQTFKIQNKTIINFSTPDYGKAFSLLDAQLDKNTPAMVSYNTKMISSESGAHASIIVGRKYNPKTGQCEYKVRNSWGNLNHFEPSTRTRHEGGYFWVSESKLKKNLYNITAFN